MTERENNTRTVLRKLRDDPEKHIEVLDMLRIFGINTRQLEEWIEILLPEEHSKDIDYYLLRFMLAFDLAERKQLEGLVNGK